MTLYSCGFLFDAQGVVALIRKNRPAWQAGKLNGVGGHVEPGESFLECMVREFEEEAGPRLEGWERFAKITSSNYEIVFFCGRVIDFENVKTMTDETIVFADSYNLPSDTVPNLQWLVPMARIGEPMMAEITYQ